MADWFTTKFVLKVKLNQFPCRLLAGEVIVPAAAELPAVAVNCCFLAAAVGETAEWTGASQLAERESVKIKTNKKKHKAKLDNC